MSRSCKECVHHNPDFIDEVCLHCSWPEFAGEPSNFKPKPITNADHIRSMTDEELAKWLERIRLCCANDLCGRSCPLAEVCYSKGAPKEMIDWLKEEAEG